MNADDFGCSSAINRAVLRAHLSGALNSASLVVAGAAAGEAAEIARRHPTLAVGLHLVAVDGPTVLPPGRIPHLVDASGEFPDSAVRLGLRYITSCAARRELAAELAAQFDRFASTGLRLAHVDGHQHMHMHPVVFSLMLPMARQFGAQRIRVVRDDLRLALRHDRHRLAGKTVATAVFALLARRCLRHCARSGFVVPDRTFGFLQSGAMDEAYVLSAIARASDNSEIYFHPADGPRVNRLGPNPLDLATLLSPAVLRAMADRASHPPLETRQPAMVDDGSGTTSRPQASA